MSNKAKVIIVLKGGLVESVYSDIPEMEYRIIDFDSRDVGEEPVNDYLQEQYGTFEDIDEKTEEILKL